jgi:aryl-alcohol dehydrogenase-like predicted oxidoreductase
MWENELGRSGLTVSAVGLGCNNLGRRLDHRGARAVIDAALDAGITHVEALEAFAEERDHSLLELAFAEGRGHSRLELAFAGLAAQPGVASMIAGAMTPEQVGRDVAAAGWELGADDRAALAEV